MIVANRHGKHVQAVTSACLSAGLEVEAVGYGVDAPCDDLEQKMAQADIVFGAARIALEAMAVGAAVVVCDARGLAGFATLQNFDAWRRANFGRRLLRNPVTPDTIATALRSYDHEQAEAITDRVRQLANLDSHLDQLESVLQDCIDRHAAAPALDRDIEAAEYSRYASQWLPNGSQGWPWEREREVLLGQVAALQAERGGR